MIELSYAIQTRIRDGIPALVTVENPATVMYALEANQEITPLLPAVFVLAGRGEPVIGNSDQARGQRRTFPLVEEQTYGIHLLVPHELDDFSHTLTDFIAGEFLVRLIKLLHGWLPDLPHIAQKESHRLTYAGREEASYSGSYAEYPLTFTARRSLTDVENP
jgi:hypothetical protein